MRTRASLLLTNDRAPTLPGQRTHKKRDSQLGAAARLVALPTGTRRTDMAINQEHRRWRFPDIPGESLRCYGEVFVRTKAFAIKELSKQFSRVGGYLDLINHDLADFLLSLNLLDQNRRNDPNVALAFAHWSFSVSLLQLVNAWQWFFAGVAIETRNYLPAQAMQMFYYSIFFSYGSFLSAQFKGLYTVGETTEKEGISPRKIRKEVWLENNRQLFSISIKDRGGSGGEHQSRANWFSEVFSGWDRAENFPAISLFKKEPLFHVEYRNMYTYSLADMGEELFSVPEISSAEAMKNVVFGLWKNEADADLFPEMTWALEHIRMCTMLHAELVNGYLGKNPMGGYQVQLLNSLLEHHKESGFDLLLADAFQPFFR
jgi:hypothetical protein